MSLIGSIGAYSSNQQFAWRGMSSADYGIQSSLHRLLGYHTTEADLRSAEMEILYGARKWGLGVGEAAPVDDMKLLADLQHYGVPTRLIDVTSNPMTALWFACQAVESDVGVSRSGVVVALNVTKWPRHASVSDAYSTTWGGLENPSGWKLAQALNEGRPFIVESSHPNERLRAQEGFFVTGAIPPSSPLVRNLSGPFFGFEVSFSAGESAEIERRLTADRGRGAPGALPFVAVIIKASLKGKLLKYLEGTFNRRADVLFPDYMGFKDYMPFWGMKDRHAVASEVEAPRSGAT